MADERVQDVPFVDGDDDDMPPLVDNPYPSMTFTFAANMTPITYSTDPTGFETTPDSDMPSSFIFSPQAPLAEPETRPPHNKKKDANYIPRPPNAFILFRSYFIRAQHVPEKIEGNHSALSKIIGKYWKALPQQEREKWEAKAIVALAEHRKKYPDWRFRPGATLLSKVKDGPRRRNNRKGRGEAEKEVKIRAKRCDKIADLLVAGKTGVDLETAIEQYDCETGGGPKANDEDGCGVLVMKIENPAELSHADSLRGERTVGQIPTPAGPAVETTKNIIQPDIVHHAMQGPPKDVRFKTPLTSMFKRASSAPAATNRTSIGGSPSPSPQIFNRRDSFSAACSAGFSDSILASSQVPKDVSDTRAKHDIILTPNQDTTRGDNVDNLLSRQAAPQPYVDVSEYDSSVTQARWFDTCIQNEANRYTPTLPAFIPDVDSPAPSPPAFPLDYISDGEYGAMAAADDAPAASCAGMPVCVQSCASYASLSGWTSEEPYPSKCMSGVYDPIITPFVVTQVSPAKYDHDSIMKDAFEAASYAQIEDYNGGYTSLHASCYWGNVMTGTSTYSCASAAPRTQWY